MKKLVLALVMLVGLNSQAQTIGDHLNTVREKKPGGKIDSEKPYTYSVDEKDVSSLMVYFFDGSLTCDRLVIVPQTSSSRQRWVGSFNDNWIIINSTEWKFYKEDGMILRCSIDYVTDVGTVFFIREEKTEN